MDFDFNDTQRSFRDAVQSYLRANFPDSELRKVWSEEHSYDHRVWKGLADIGVAGLLIDEEFGGFSGAVIDLTLVLEEAGAFAVPEPIVETALIAPLVIGTFGDEATKRRWLPGIAAGDVVVAFAEGATGAIVPDGLDADLVLVRDQGVLHLVERSQVSGQSLRGIDPSRRLSECNIELSESTVLTGDPAASLLVDRVGAAATACLLVGLSQRLLETTRDYVLSRHQFGRPIADFQAVKHRLADVAMQTEAARSLAWHAIYCLQSSADVVPSASALAKSAASRAAYLAGSAALQLHGGIGFTWEHDLHLRLQRGKAWEVAFGNTDQHRARSGATILGVA